jgi:clavulanate-9-aldehyde reductase
MTSLQGRRILITGATSGIGRATADAVVAAGGRVALLARSEDAVQALAGMLGDVAVATPADVTDARAVSRAVEVAAGGLGGLDGVVSSAGAVRPGGILQTTPDDWRATFEVNVLGVLHVIGAALPHLRQAELADVVNVSSMSGRRRASVAMGIYSASKFAVHVLSDSLREELAPEGVRVTIVSPGYVRTPIFDGVADDEIRAEYQRRLATVGLDPEAVADQIVHALSQPAGVDLLEVAVMSTRQ